MVCSCVHSDSVLQPRWTAQESQSASQQGAVVCWAAGRQQLQLHMYAWPPTQPAVQGPGRAMRSCLLAGKPPHAALPVLRQAVRHLHCSHRHHADAARMPPFSRLAREPQTPEPACNVGGLKAL